VGRVLDEPVLRIRGPAGGELCELDIEALRAAHQGGFAG
jgi:hypothetical protein